MMNTLKQKAKEYFEENLSGEPLTQEAIEEALVEFAQRNIRPIFNTHKERLSVMKDNLSRWGVENWSDSDIKECERMISSLASILSDLNKEIL